MGAELWGRVCVICVLPLWDQHGYSSLFCLVLSLLRVRVFSRACKPQWCFVCAHLISIVSDCSDRGVLWELWMGSSGIDGIIHADVLHVRFSFFPFLVYWR